MTDSGIKDEYKDTNSLVSVEKTYKYCHNNPIVCVSFSPDDSKFCSVCRGGKLAIWGTMSGELEMENVNHRKDITFVDFSPVGRLIATSSNDSDIRLWDPENIKDGSIHEFEKAHRNGIYCVKFDWDGRRIYSGSKDRNIKKWDVEKKVNDLTLNTDCWVGCIDVSKDNNLVVSGHAYPYSVKFWDVREKRMVKEINNFRNIVSSVKIQPGKNQNLVATGDWNHKVKVFDVRKYKLLYEFGDHTKYVSTVCFHPSGKYLLSGGDDRKINFFNLILSSSGFLDDVDNEKNSKSGRRLVFSVSSHRNYVNSVCFSSDGKHFISGSYDKTIILWKLKMMIHDEGESLSKKDEEERIHYLVEIMEMCEKDEDKNSGFVLIPGDILKIKIPSCSLEMFLSKSIFFGML